MTDAAPELAIQGLTRHYPRGPSVGPFSLQVARGEFFSVLGPSGCGKSTLLRCLSGFESADAGSILLGGRDITQAPPNRRDIGLVFQSHALFPHLTVFENIAFGLRLRRRPAAEITERVGEALRLVGLEALAARQPAQLSGGQQQRVAIARSLVIRPRLLLLDEPLSSLDLKLRVQMREDLHALQRQLGTTTLYVTHDQTEALALSDRIAVLSPAGIEQIGTPEEVYTRPASLFVARFIGGANLLEGVVEAAPGGCRLRLAEGTSFQLAATPAAGTNAIAVLRPERLQPATPGDTNAFAAEVVEVTFLGEDLELRLRTPWAPTLRMSVKAGFAAAQGLSLAPGAVWQLRVAPEDLPVLPG